MGEEYMPEAQVEVGAAEPVAELQQVEVKETTRRLLTSPTSSSCPPASPTGGMEVTQRYARATDEGQAPELAQPSANDGQTPAAPQGSSQSPAASQAPASSSQAAPR